MSKAPTLKRALRIAFIVTTVLLIAIAAKLRYDGQLRAPVYDHERPVVPALARPAVLVFSKTNGFIHREAIPAAQELLQALGKKQGWSVYLTDNAAIHNPEDLARFDAIVWNNVSGDVLLPEQRAALQAYVENGGGFIGLHGAGGDPSYDWHWYPEALIRAQFTGHPMWPQFQEASVQVEKRDDPIVSHLEPRFTLTDEWYSFRDAPKNVQVLLTLDERSYKPEVLFIDLRMGAHHPIAWKHCQRRGRVFYSALGHLASTYADARYQRVLEQAVGWAMTRDAQVCP